MLIAFDARMHRHSGIGQYIYNLLSQFQKIGTKHNFLLLGEVYELASIFYSERFSFYRFTEPIYSLSEQALFPVSAITDSTSKIKCDLLHIPHYNIPLKYKNGKLIVTIHDLAHLCYPANIFVYLYASFMLKNAARKADKIISVSQFTKKEMISKLNVPEEKIITIYYGLNQLFKPIENERQRIEIAEYLSNKYGISGDYILSVGIYKPHKNFMTLLNVYDKLIKEEKIPHKLVLAGFSTAQCKPLIKKIAQLKLSDRVIILGYLDWKELILIYNKADLFISLSLYEGFGLPVLEAMACGVPVVASNTASLPEVVEEAGLLVDPYNIDEIKEKVLQVLFDKNLKSRLIEKGYQQANKFSWEETAKKTLAVYESIIA